MAQNDAAAKRDAATIGKGHRDWLFDKWLSTVTFSTF